MSLAQQAPERGAAALHPRDSSILKSWRQIRPDLPVTAFFTEQSLFREPFLRWYLRATQQRKLEY